MTYPTTRLAKVDHSAERDHPHDQEQNTREGEGAATQAPGIPGWHGHEPYASAGVTRGGALTRCMTFLLATYARAQYHLPDQGSQRGNTTNATTARPAEAHDSTRGADSVAACLAPPSATAVELR